MSDREIGNQVVVTPAADARGLVRGDVEGAPARGDRTGEFLAVVERERKIARCMAFAAMRERFGEIGASVPFRALRGVRLVSYVRIEDLRPEHHRPALV